MASVVEETADAHSLVLDVTPWPGHVAGQHVDVRLTAPDGYQATRSYSLSSGPGEAPSITVQEVEDGEVSTYLVRDTTVGDTFECAGRSAGTSCGPASTAAAPGRRRVRARPLAGDVARGRPHRPGRRPGVGDHPAPAAVRRRVSPNACAPVRPRPPCTCPGRTSPRMPCARGRRSRPSRSGRDGSTRHPSGGARRVRWRRGGPGRVRLRADLVRRGRGRPARRCRARPPHRARRTLRLTPTHHREAGRHHE